MDHWNKTRNGFGVLAYLLFCWCSFYECKVIVVRRRRRRIRRKWRNRDVYKLVNICCSEECRQEKDEYYRIISCLKAICHSHWLTIYACNYTMLHPFHLLQSLSFPVPLRPLMKIIMQIWNGNEFKLMFTFMCSTTIRYNMLTATTRGHSSIIMPTRQT